MEKLKNLSKRNKIIIGIVIILLVIYFAGAYYYSNHFLKGTTVNGINCSNKTAAQLEKQMKKNIDSYLLTIKERKDLQDTVKGSDIDLAYLDNGAIAKYQKSQNAFVWPAGYFGSKYNKNIDTVSYDEKKLDKIFKKFNCFKKKNIKKPVSAYPKYDGNNKYKIVPEDDGTQIVKDTLRKAVETCIAGGEETLDADKSGCYKEPDYRKDDKEITQLKTDMEKMVSGSITWDYSNRYINLTKFKDGLKDNKFTVNGDITNKFIKIKNHTKATIDSKKIEDWLISYANDSNTIYKSRKFKSHSGRKITVPSGGPYGWRMHVEKETKAIKKMMQEGSKETRQPLYKQKAVENTNGKLNDIGNSYVEVDISSQSVYVYKNGKQVFATSCVTGDVTKGRGTHTGACVVQYKQRNKVLGGPGYDYASPVSYWMPFNGGEGLHDATWRHGSFGGSIYKGNGSHGCVNLDISAAATIYGIIDAGWPVIVHY
ncbi:MAG: L,D-transpeptidase family protein [Lachnospiraceae bacterium]|nr:L,D-transpeptidase family protein [Lachnospiraceae bacterium]